MNRLRQILPILLSCCLVLPSVPEVLASQADQSATQPQVQPAQLGSAQLQQLVAPIALYPDALVAQVLAAATYPDQVVEADRWIEQHSELRGEQLAQEVDKQTWDPSVKALTEFPSVLANMDKNLSWTSSLGDAYINQQQDVMNAVQVMRQRAKEAGNLKTTSQEKVGEQGKTVVIEPADPDVVYVPVYDPWVVYGAPIVVWPGWYWYPGCMCPDRASPLVWALASVSSAGLAGDGTTGARTGTTTESFTTTLPTSPTAERSLTAAITPIALAGI